MRWLNDPDIGAPFWSLAGVKRARRLITLHVAVSSALDPDDDEIEHPDTRPSVPIVRLTEVVPFSSLRMADAG